MYKYLALLLIIILLFCKCNSNTQQKSEIPVPVDQTKKDEIKFYDIKGFLSFSANSTLESTISYFEQNNIVYIENPDIRSGEYFPKRNPMSIFLLFDCPLVKYVFVPEIKIEDLSLKKILFAFYDNALCLITTTEFNEMNNSTIYKLKSFYETKYGEATEHTLENQQANQKLEYWTYRNNQDTIKVSFSREFYSYRDSDHMQETFDEFAIVFPNERSLKGACESRTNGIRRKKQQEEAEKAKKVLENL